MRDIENLIHCNRNLDIDNLKRSYIYKFFLHRSNRNKLMVLLREKEN